jgi:DNA-binding NarL/FixJ family response regulator
MTAISVPPRLLIVEDDPRIVAAVTAILAPTFSPNLEIAGTIAQAQRVVAASRPDILLVDLGLPDGDGTDLIRWLRVGGFRGSLLVLTSSTSDDRILASLRAGADGYLFKEDLDQRLAVALRDLAGGGSPLSPGAAKVVLRQLQLGGMDIVRPILTPREADVLRQLATGSGYAEAAGNLGIELNTFRTHIRSLYSKLGVENRAEAVNLAWGLGLLSH